MSYTVSFLENDGWLTAQCCGQLKGFSDLCEQAQVILEKIEALGTRYLFLDDRDLDLAVDVHYLSRLVDQFGEKGLSLMGFRIACMCKPNNRQLYKTLETIYQNRSFNFRLFDDEKRAVTWLVS